MEKQVSLTLPQKLSQRANNWLMTKLVPLDHPGKFCRWLFKLPVLFYNIGLSILVPKWILILATTGRKTGKSRKTPIGFWYRPGIGAYWVMSGWAGNTDWYQNVRANHSVQVQIRNMRFEAYAEPLSVDETVEYLFESIRINPGAMQIFSRWANRPLEPSENDLQEAAPLFPSLAIYPLSRHET